MGLFWFFGAVIASLAGATLRRGTFLEHLWIRNPRAYRQLSPLGITVGIAFPWLGAILAAAGAGWLFGRFWGWVLAVVVIATQVLANLAEAARGSHLRGSVVFLLSSSLLYFLLRPKGPRRSCKADSRQLKLASSPILQQPWNDLMPV